MAKTKVAVMFGGRSTEHEVSIITGIQVMHALNKSRYEIIPIYVTKDGEWILGDDSFYEPKNFSNLEKLLSGKKRILLSTDATSPVLIEKPKELTIMKSLIVDRPDVFFPAFHGRYGEDGAVQGLLEFSNIAYVGCGVSASAVGMDKALSKSVAYSIGIPMPKSVWITKTEWTKNSKAVVKRIESQVSFPVFMKPARLGSSIGVVKIGKKSELERALEVGFYYDEKILLEEAVKNPKEINISIMGNHEYKVSACEQPIKSEELLSFEDKYISTSGKSKGMASSKRILPAKIKKATQDKIEKYAKGFFREINGRGIARLDFLLSQDETKIYFNEINTMPGSVAFYLWKEAGVSFDKLVNKLVDLALKEQKSKLSLTSTFSSNILKGFDGAKFSKS